MYVKSFTFLTIRTASTGNIILTIQDQNVNDFFYRPTLALVINVRKYNDYDLKEH